MAPRQHPAKRDDVKKTAQPKDRWSRSNNVNLTSQLRSSSRISKKSTRVGPRPSTPAAKNRSRLLKLTTELISHIFKQLDKPSLNNTIQTCQSLWTIGIKPLYENDVHLLLIDRTFGANLTQLRPMFEYIERFTRDLKLVVKDCQYSQRLFQSLVPYLQSTALNSLTFTAADDPDDKEDGFNESALNGESWALLDDTLCNQHLGEYLRSTLRNIKLPEYDLQSVRSWTGPDGQLHTRKRGLLDSRIVLEFKSTILQPGKTFRFAAAGNQETVDRPANGTPEKVGRRLLSHIGVGTDIDYFSMHGTHAETVMNPRTYLDPFVRLQIQGPINLTKIVFHDMKFKWLPTSIADSINFSSIKSVHIVQCQHLHLLFRLFMLSNSRTTIEDLWIQLLDWETEGLRRDDPHGFKQFIASFSSLKTLKAKVCGTWDFWSSDEEESWISHEGLRVFDADFGNESDLFLCEMDDLARECPNIEFYGSRDLVLSAPLQDGDWSEVFEEEAPMIAETLVTQFPAITTWKVYFSPVPIGQPVSSDFEGCEDVYGLLASRLHDYVKEACDEYRLECKLNMIILAIQDVLIPDETFRREGLPEELIYNF